MTKAERLEIFAGSMFSGEAAHFSTLAVSRPAQTFFMEGQQGSQAVGYNLLFYSIALYFLVIILCNQVYSQGFTVVLQLIKIPCDPKHFPHKLPS